MSATVYFDTDPDADFEQCCARSASALRELGVGQGEVVALMLQNEPVLLELMLAARCAGAHFCLINWHFKAAEVRHILRDSAAKVLIVHAHLLETIRDAIPPTTRVFIASPRERTCRAFDLQSASFRPIEAQQESWASFRDARPRAAVAMDRPGSAMLYTSGTTGLAKGVRRQPASPQQAQAVTQSTRIALGIEEGMRALVSAPLYHAAPASYGVQAALHDAHLWLEPRFDGEETLRMIESRRISHAYMVPTMFRRLLQLPAQVRSAHDLSSLRFVACTGAPCPVETKQRMIEWWGPVIHESYAASELGYVTHIDSHDALRKPGSAGRALPGTRLKVVSEAGEDLPAGSVGLIYARNPAVPDFTYSNNDSARSQMEHDGLWGLGDMGYLDEEGFLFIVDRKADMVISGGVNIYPAEIEAVLVQMAGVADCAVFGVPHEEFGEALLAVVQPAAGARLAVQDIQSYLHERLAGFKVPRRVVFQDELPREETGKIFKRKLRDPYWAGVDRRV